MKKGQICTQQSTNMPSVACITPKLGIALWHAMEIFCRSTYKYHCHMSVYIDKNAQCQAAADRSPHKRFRKIQYQGPYLYYSHSFSWEKTH